MPSFSRFSVCFFIYLMALIFNHYNGLATAGEKQLDTNFKDVTIESGIDFEHSQGAERINAIPEVIGSGAAFVDYDNDGFLDLYVVNGSGYTYYYGGETWWGKNARNVLYHNNGDGTFKDVTEIAGVGHKGWGMGCAFADYDNDGDKDLYITNYGLNILYRNNGNGTFTDITELAGVGDGRWSTSSTWLDYYGNGLLDLYVVNYVRFKKTMNPNETNLSFKMVQQPFMRAKLFDAEPNTLYRNNGDGTFSDVTLKADVANITGRGLGVITVDFDNDGDSDIYVVNDSSRNILYQNNGDGTFVDVASSGVDSPLSGMGVDFGDYDNDGDMDIFSTYPQNETNILYQNNQNKHHVINGHKEEDQGQVRYFKDVTVKAGLGEDVSMGWFGWGMGFLDHNNDGYLDIFVGNGHIVPDYDNPKTCVGQSNQLFENDGDGSFVAVPVSLGPKSKNSTRGVAFGDYNNDGKTDIFVVNNNGFATLLQNIRENKNNWITLSLEGVNSNKDAIGARIELRVKNMIQIREVKGGSGYLSQNDIRPHFGLGNAKKIDEIKIQWPSGLRQVFRDIPVNKFLTLTEGNPDKIFHTFPPYTAPVMFGQKESIFLRTIVKTLGGFKDKRAVKPLIPLLTNNSPTIREETVIALSQIRDHKAFASLLMRLKDSDIDVRVEAVKAMGVFQSNRSVNALILALQDSHHQVRGAAANVLGSFFEDEEEVLHTKQLAVVPLILTLKNEVPYVRKEAVKALGLSESDRAVVPLIEKIDDTDSAVRREVVLALGLTRDKRAEKPLLKTLGNVNEDESVRAAAIISLARLKSTAIVESLFNALNHVDELVRLKALQTLKTLFASDLSVVFKKQQIIEPLVKCLGDVSVEVKAEAISALGLIKDRKLLPYFLKSIKEEDYKIRRESIKSLQFIRSEEAMLVLIESLMDKHNLVKAEAAIALRPYRNVVLINPLIDALEKDDIDFKVKKEIIITLSKIRNASVIDVFINIAKNKEEYLEVRKMAIIALNNYLTYPQVIETIISLTDDYEPEIRLSVISLFGNQSNNKQFIKPLVEALGDKDVNVRYEAAKIMGVFRDRDVILSLTNKISDLNEEEKVFRRVVLSLQQLGIYYAIPYLMEQLKSINSNAKERYIIALGIFQNKRVVKQLVNIIKQEDVSFNIRCAAIEALTMIDKDSALECLISLF